MPTIYSKISSNFDSEVDPFYNYAYYKVPAKYRPVGYACAQVTWHFESWWEPYLETTQQSLAMAKIRDLMADGSQAHNSQNEGYF